MYSGDCQRTCPSQKQVAVKGGGGPGEGALDPVDIVDNFPHRIVLPLVFCPRNPQLRGAPHARYAICCPAAAPPRQAAAGARPSSAECGRTSGLEGEVELLDGLQEREASLSERALDAGLLAMGDLLGDQHAEERPARPAMSLCAIEQLPPAAAGVGQVEPGQQRIELHGGRIVGQRVRGGGAHRQGS